MKRLVVPPLAALILAVAACGPGGGSTAETTTPSATRTVTSAPDTVGMLLDEARLALEDAGYTVKASDSREDRTIVMEGNWVVTSQEVQGTTATLGAEKATDSAATTASAPAADDAASGKAKAAAVERYLLDSFGIKTFSDYLAQDPASWVGTITEVRVDGTYLYVTVADRTVGQRAAQSLSTLLPSNLVEGISWIIVEDANGVVIEQKQPAPLA